LGIVREVEVAAQAGYDAIEPWMGTLDAYVKGGGSLKDLGKRIRDLGLTVESAIGFAQWIVDDEAARNKGFEQAKRDMDTLIQIGGKRIAAPPAGATDKPGPDLATAAARYLKLLELGDQMGIVPEAEVWGFSKTLSRLSETVYVAVAAGHPKACVLPDVYHLHKGGSGFEGLKLLSGIAVQMFHINDYPADPPRETINDSHRVYPGDGVAPLPEMLRDLRLAGFHGFLSLELFNKDYWKQDALAVAKTGLEKMKSVVAKSL
jgi:sugar phosphate isomerase/epimerase